MGLMVSHGYAARPAQIRAIRSALQMLETEINYALTPLPEALARVGSRVEGAVGNYFFLVSERLKGENPVTAGEAWIDALKWLVENTTLAESDINILKSFGHNLGNSDREEQLKHLRLTQEHLRHQEIFAEKNREQNERIWRTIGFLGGLLIVIILF